MLSSLSLSKMMRLAICFALLAAATADQLRSKNHAEGFVRSLEFKHRLRVCNAYPYNAALDVYRGKSEKLTSDGAMPYKACQDFTTPLKAGDKLEFRVGMQVQEHSPCPTFRTTMRCSCL